MNYYFVEFDGYIKGTVVNVKAGLEYARQLGTEKAMDWLQANAYSHFDIIVITKMIEISKLDYELKHKKHTVVL